MKKIPVPPGGSGREDSALILLRTLLILSCVSLFADRTYAQLPASSGPGDSSYGGPSVLSRGLLPSVSSRNADIAFVPYIAASGICDSGLTGIGVDSKGRLPSFDQCGIEGAVGITGYHRWKKSRLGLTYNGDFFHYFKNSYYDNSNQMLLLSYRDQLSKRWSIGLREAAGTYSRSYGYAPGGSFFDVAVLPSPTTELFDNRVVFLNTSADATYLKSARWSFNFGGDGYMVRRRSTSLYGVTVGGAHGDAIYRYSRFGSIGVAYQFYNYSFTKAFGSSDIHIATLQYSVRLTRSWEFAAALGAARVETLGFGVIQVDPAIAAITGQSQAVISVYRVNHLPNLEGALTREFRNATLNFRYTRGISPGNGVYLTSAQEYASTGFRYSGVRHWGFEASGGYTRLTGLVQQLGQYRSYLAGISASRSLAGGVSATLRLEANRYSTNGPNDFRRNAYRAALGLSWSPGEVPVTLW